MRGKNALVSLLMLGVLVSGSPAAGEPVPGRAADLPQEIDGGVIVDLADGDRFKVTVSRDLHTVWGSRYDAATGVWGRRSVVLRKNDVFCGDVDARAAGNAVALIAECDRGGYAEDQAPTHSQALYSPDTLTWQSFTLPGEAYDEPGISPSGTNAIWPLYQGWVTHTPAGFEVVQRELPGQEYTSTGTISDAGDVSVLYGAPQAGECALSVLSVSASGVETAQRLDVDGACSDVNLANADADTVLFGEFAYPEWVTTITRPDALSPWAVTGIPPIDAPGLVRYRGKGTAATLFPSSRGLPLLAVGSPDQVTFTAQAYDPVAQRWSLPAQIKRTAKRCSWGDNFIDEPFGVYALRIDCGKKQRVLVSTDALVWHDVGLGGAPLGVSPDGRLVSASNRTRTLIFSRERGLVRLPLPTRARCDLIQPFSPDSAIRLTSVSQAGWPGRLDVSTSTGWQKTKTKVPRPRVGSDVCTGVQDGFYERPTNYFFQGRELGFTLVVTPRGDGWKIKRTVS